MGKIKVDLFTARAGGPYQWGQDLLVELPRWGIWARTSDAACRVYAADHENRNRFIKVPLCGPSRA